MGCFPKREEIPETVVDFVRRAVHLPEGTAPRAASRTAERQRTAVRQRTGADEPGVATSSSCSARPWQRATPPRPVTVKRLLATSSTVDQSAAGSAHPAKSSNFAQSSAARPCGCESGPRPPPGANVSSRRERLDAMGGGERFAAGAMASET
jgi:hypothetical protein